MKILHTSDWHLGRTLHGHLLFEAQEVAVNFIVDEAIRLKVAAVIIAGDAVTLTDLAKPRPRTTSWEPSSASKSPTTQTATPTQQINAAADAIGLIGDALTQQRGVFTTKVLNGVEKFKADNKRDPAYGEVQQIIKDVGTELSQVPDFLTPQQKPSAQPTRTVDQQLSVAHDKLGIAGDKKAEERGAFDSLIVGEIDAYRAANGGRDPDYTAVQKVIDRATKETVVTKDWWPDSTVSPLTVEVPAEDRAAISDAFQRKRGRAPSELEVREAYIAKKAAQ